MGFMTKNIVTAEVAERIQIKGEHSQANNHHSNSGFLLPFQCLYTVELKKLIPKVWVVAILLFY